MKGREGKIVFFPVTVLAQNRGLRGTEYGGRGIIAGIAEKSASVLGEELVSGVNLTVTSETEFC